MYTCNVTRSFNQTAQSLILTDSIDAVVDSLQCPHEILGHRRFYDSLGISTFHQPLHLRVSNMELIFHLSSKDIPVGTNIFLQVVGHGNNELAIAGNGIVELARMELSQRDTFIATHGLEQEAAKHLDGVGTLLVDIVA